MALSISLDTINGAIKSESSVLKMLNPLPLVINCDGGIDFRCFVTIYDYFGGERGAVIAQGLEMIEIYFNKFAIDLQDVFSSKYEHSAPFRWYDYEVVVQAQSGGTYVTESYICKCLPYTTQFGESAYIGDVEDEDIIAKCNEKTTFYGVANVQMPFNYVSSLSVASNSFRTYSTEGIYTETAGGVTYTFIIARECENEIIVRYLDKYSRWRLFPLGNYYSETIEAEEATNALQAIVNTEVSLSDRYNLHKNATKRLSVVAKGVSREQMEVLKYLIYSPRVYLKKGAGDYVMVNAQCDTNVFSTKQQFFDFKIDFTFPKMYTI